jgi:hypothetical protein
MRGRDERIRVSGLVLIVVVLVVRLSYDATNGALTPRVYALINLTIALGVAGVVVLACAALPQARKNTAHARLRIIARKRRGSEQPKIHLN